MSGSWWLDIVFIPSLGSFTISLHLFVFVPLAFILNSSFPFLGFSSFHTPDLFTENNHCFSAFFYGGKPAKANSQDKFSNPLISLLAYLCTHSILNSYCFYTSGLYVAFEVKTYQSVYNGIYTSLFLQKTPYLMHPRNTFVNFTAASWGLIVSCDSFICQDLFIPSYYLMIAQFVTQILVISSLGHDCTFYYYILSHFFHSVSHCKPVFPVWNSNSSLCWWCLPNLCYQKISLACFGFFVPRLLNENIM